MSIKLVVFDWDGTLVDSEAHIVSCLTAASLALGLPLHEPKTYSRIIGLSMERAIDALYPQLDNEGHKEFRKAYRECFYSEGYFQATLFEGAEELLRALKLRGLRLAVATGKGLPGLEKALDQTGLRSYFDCYRCADTTASKPDPLMLFEIMSQCGVSADEVVMVGDTHYDLEMAANAGVRKVAVSFGVHELDVLQKFHPEAVIHHLSELESLIASW